MERYDIAVVGTGPAGLEAAITAKIRNKKVLLLGGDVMSAKVEKAHTVRNYLGLPEVTGEEMRRAFAEHLKRADLSVTRDRVNAVYAMGDYFAIQGHRDMYEASAVILACGVSASRQLPGEAENLGMGVSYCATCDAALYRGKTAVVLGYSKEAEEEAAFLAEIAREVIYLPMYPGCAGLGGGIRTVSGEKPLSVRREGRRMRLLTENSVLEADGIFILREDVAPAQLVPGLALEDNHAAVDRAMRTNIGGLFACGDMTGAPYQYIKAAGEGNVAALSAVKYLSEKKKPG